MCLHCYIWNSCGECATMTSSCKSKNTSGKIKLTSAGLLQIFDGLPSGQARMVEGKRGHIYEGRWAAGLRHGQVLPKHIRVSTWIYVCIINIRFGCNTVAFFIRCCENYTLWGIQFMNFCKFLRCNFLTLHPDRNLKNPNRWTIPKVSAHIVWTVFTIIDIVWWN